MVVKLRYRFFKPLEVFDTEILVGRDVRTNVLTIPIISSHLQYSSERWRRIILVGALLDRYKPSSPIPKILQRVCDDFHTITHHCLNIYLLVLFRDRGQEENQPPLRFEHRA